MSQPLVVEPYDPEWPHAFHQLQTFLYRNLVGTYHAVEHVGSTSVPGMAAKPIIDVDVVARDGKFEQIKNRLIAAGYEYEGEKGIPGRESFGLKDPGLKQALPEHHLYVLAADAAELRRHRAFRDYLIAHPEWVEKLSAHKLELAARLGDDRAGYQAAKEPMVLEILTLALREASA
jgi:GrpB-like predicted nucleotidyltransferase (UPF0157 family)